MIEEPLFPVEEMGSIIPADTKKPFDIRKVCVYAISTSTTTFLVVYGIYELYSTV